MIFPLRHFARRFRNEETGSMTVEFVLQFSIFFAVFAASVEIGYMNIRHAMLDRALDETVRELRLGTGLGNDYGSVKSGLCDVLTVADDCDDNLRIEMVQVDPRAFTPLHETADCQNAAQDIRPVTDFSNGTENALMLIRACLKFKPKFPTTGLAAELNMDENGYAQLTATAVFVQEPR